jgi:hypothetical protein
MDAERYEYARSLMLALLATDREYNGRYAAELTVHRAARKQ